MKLLSENPSSPTNEIIDEMSPTRTFRNGASPFKYQLKNKYETERSSKKIVKNKEFKIKDFDEKSTTEN